VHQRSDFFTLRDPTGKICVKIEMSGKGARSCERSMFVFAPKSLRYTHFDTCG
jgi:hypothetical protein